MVGAEDCWAKAAEDEPSAAAAREAAEPLRILRREKNILLVSIMISLV